MKMPPPEKIYEAWSALASGRFHSVASPDSPAGEAVVISSSGKKEYHLKWDNDTCFSDDPATWWQNYPGYPVIALLMYRSLLPYDPDIAQYFANVQWEKVNNKAKRDYAEALKLVFETLKLPEDVKKHIQSFANKSFAALSNLSIKLRRLIKPEKPETQS